MTRWKVSISWNEKSNFFFNLKYFWLKYRQHYYYYLMHFRSGLFVLHTGKKTFWIGNWFYRNIHIFFKIANKQIFSFNLFSPSFQLKILNFKNLFFFLGWCISRPLNEIPAKYWRWFSTQDLVKISSLFFHPRIHQESSLIISHVTAIIRKQRPIKFLTKKKQSNFIFSKFAKIIELALKKVLDFKLRLEYSLSWAMFKKV
jgi:hypothetical protein